jgi:arginyl-tRNA synthetase
MEDALLLLKENIKKSIKSVYDLEFDDIFVERPEDEKHGDLATNVAFLLAKKIFKPPLEIAENLSHEISGYDICFECDGANYPVFSSIEVVSPGFINFRFSDYFLKNQLSEVLKKNDNYGSNKKGQGRVIIVEYSAPNPNKPLHIGHSRNNFLGSSISEILSFNSYNVVKMNYMNDWGTHICKSMLMYKKYGNGRDPDKKPDHFVGDFYRMYEVEHEKNPEKLDKELAEMFREMEQGKKETLELWKKITGWAYEGWKETYENENVSFDVCEYQSNYTKAGKEIIDYAIEKEIAEKDDSGAIIARLGKYGIPDKVLLRSDGTPIYITQDIQLAKDNFEKYNFEKRIYVVDKRQSDYFKQLFKLFELLGFKWADRLYHLAYGWVSLPEGAMSSRAGTVVNADDVFEKIFELEQEEVKNSLKEVTDLEKTSKKIALAAYRYGMLKIDPRQDIVFDMNGVTRFEGNTGPYLMYTYARAMSIIEKSGIEASSLESNIELFENIKMEEKEVSLLRFMCTFPETVSLSADTMSPHLIANFLYNFAQKFNSFYSEVPVLNAKEDLRFFRLVLVCCSAQVIKNGLKLLGINVVEKM